MTRQLERSRSPRGAAPPRVAHGSGDARRPGPTLLRSPGSHSHWRGARHTNADSAACRTASTEISGARALHISGDHAVANTTIAGIAASATLVGWSPAPGTDCEQITRAAMGLGTCHSSLYVGTCRRIAEPALGNAPQSRESSLRNACLHHLPSNQSFINTTPRQALSVEEWHDFGKLVETEHA